MGFGPELLICKETYSTPFKPFLVSSFDGGVVRGLWHLFEASGTCRSRMLPEKGRVEGVVQYGSESVGGRRTCRSTPGP